MAGFKSKINKKMQKKQESAKVNEMKNLKTKMLQQYEAKEYVDAMDTMAEIAGLKNMDSEVMALGASCYFMTGDYDRAAVWINNTLKYEPGNVSARILLGRLCFVQNKTSEGFAVLNYVLENLQSRLTGKGKTDLLDVLSHCDENMHEEMSKYAALLDYLKANKSDVDVDSNIDQTKKEEAFVTAEDAADNKNDNVKSLSAVERLKALMKKNKREGDITAAEIVLPSENMANGSSGTALDSLKSLLKKAKEKENKEKTLEKQDTNNVDLIKSIMKKNVGYAQKVKLLNAFAGNCYVKKDYTGALKYLQKAAELDPDNNTILCNICYSYIALNDIEKAMKVAASMPMIDFAVLKAIGD